MERLVSDHILAISTITSVEGILAANSRLSSMAEHNKIWGSQTGQAGEGSLSVTGAGQIEFHE